MDKNPDLKIELTADGSATLYVEQLDEHYHSVKGALAESEHIYRDCAFLHRAKSNFTPPLRLLEIGFGTGLNAAVTAAITDDSRPLYYISLEKYPVDADTLQELHYDKLVDAELFSKIHFAQWNQPTQITPSFTLEKRKSDFLADALPRGIDIVYFDAFAPEKQPEMWSEQALRKVFNAMNPGAVLTTYCAKGSIRRLLESIGLDVERIAGPAGGKREILRAVKAG